MFDRTWPASCSRLRGTGRECCSQSGPRQTPCTCVRGGEHGDRYGGVGSAVRVVGNAGGSSMAVGDGFDDREAESGAVLAAGGVGASEALEGVIKKGWWKAWAVVTDPQFEQTVVGTGAEADRGAAVAQRVVEEVGERLLESRRVGVDEQSVGRVDADLGGVAGPRVAGCDRGEQFRGPGLLSGVGELGGGGAGGGGEIV